MSSRFLRHRSPKSAEGRQGRRRSTRLLSGREAEVLKLLGAGHKNRHRAIGLRLGLGVKRIETYRARLCDKLGLRGRADLVRYALQAGLVSAERLPPKGPE